MIHVLCSGGLGNQMFQYAFYKNLSLKDNDVNFDTSYFKYNSVHNGYELERCFGIKTPIDKKSYFNATWKTLYGIMARFRKKVLFNVKMESYFKNHTLEEIKSGDILYGFWQSEKYFIENKDKIIKDFNFMNISLESHKMAGEILNTTSVAIHIRRGDYLSISRYVNLTQTNYYKNAIEYLSDIAENLVFYVFSDDLNWCKENMDFPGKTIYVDFNIGENSYEDMFLMSKAKYIVLANSSFSWWAGYLGQHELVLRPSKYKTTWSESDDAVLYPKAWKKIEV